MVLSKAKEKEKEVKESSHVTLAGQRDISQEIDNMLPKMPHGRQSKEHVKATPKVTARANVKARASKGHTPLGPKDTEEMATVTSRPCSALHRGKELGMILHGASGKGMISPMPTLQ